MYKKIGLLAVFVVLTLLVSHSASAANEGRYLIKSNSIFVRNAFSTRHVFDNGFTADVSDTQLRLLKFFNVEFEPVEKLHILEPVSQIEPENKKLGSGKNTRSVPSDQIPWGVETIYNDVLLSSASGGANVNVAVLDTGVLKSHPDLKNRINQCKDFTLPRIPVSDGKCDDKNGHGTHVSGTILADGGSDKLGIYGIAPAAKLFSYKVCDNNGSCWADDIASAIRTAADNGANVVNMSFGSDSPSQLIIDAINYGVSKDVLFVAAAGNDGPYAESIDYPGANVNVVAVGAINPALLVPDWSSRGINDKTTAYINEEKDVEFGAPGLNIESTWKNGGYAILSGTSMATPHVVGLAAKLWKVDAPEGERAATTRDLLHTLIKDIWDFGDDTATGFGLPRVPVTP